MKPNETKIKVRYAETDQMGIVHHSNYFVWYEVGRTELIKQIGMSYSEMEKKGVGMPLVDCGCKFKTGARYEDEIIIRTMINEIDPVRINFRYEVIREADGKLLAEGYTTHAFVGENFRAMNLKKKNQEIWELLNKEI